MFIFKNLFSCLLLGFAESSPPSQEHGWSQPCPLHTCSGIPAQVRVPPQDYLPFCRRMVTRPHVGEASWLLLFLMDVQKAPGNWQAPLALTSLPPSGPVLMLKH